MAEISPVRGGDSTSRVKTERQQRVDRNREHLQSRPSVKEQQQENKDKSVPKPPPTPPVDPLAGAKDAIKTAGNFQIGAIDKASDLLNKNWKHTSSKWDQIANGGTLAYDKLQKGVMDGSFTQDPFAFKFDQKQPDVFKPDQFNQTNWKDAGYDFRLQQGTDALNTSAAAAGGGLSGAQLKALTAYGQEMGSQEYQNSFNRWALNAGVQQSANQAALNQFNTNRNFEYGKQSDVYTMALKQKQDQYGQLGDLTKAGVGAIQEQNNLSTANAGNQANLTMQKGNVEAAMTVAPHNLQMQHDMWQAEQNQKQSQIDAQNKSSIFGFLGTALGGLAGLLVTGGNPMGAAAGASIFNGLFNGSR